MALGLGSKLTKGGADPYAMYRSRYSVHFDGTNDYIAIDDSTTFDHKGSDSDSQFTIACWFKFDVLPSVRGESQVLMCKWDIQGDQREWLLYSRSSDNKLVLALSSNGEGDSSGDSDDTLIHEVLGTAISDTKWHHVVVSYNGDPSQATAAWIDGVSQTVNADAQKDSGFASVHEGTSKVYIGAKKLADGSGWNNHMNGYIADPIYINKLVAGGKTATYMYNKGKPRNLSRYVGYVDDVSDGTTDFKKVYWQMGDGTEKATGTTLYDMANSTNDDNGTLTNGPTFENESPGLGRDSYSFLFDGTNDYVDVGPSNGLVTGNTVTVAFWAKVTDTDGAYAFANARGDAASNFSVSLNRNSGSNSAGWITGYVWNGSSINAVAYDGNIDDSQWHHYAFTTSASAQVLYLDGVAVATGSNTFSNAAHADHNTHIGNLKGGSFYLGGNISDMVLFNTTLTAAQVRENMGPGLDLNNLSTTANIVAWWRFGDGALDYKQLNYHSTGCLGDENNATVGSDVLGGKGDFSDPSYWTLTTNRTVIENGKGKWLSTAGGYGHIKKDGILTVNQIYELIFDVDSNTGGDDGTGKIHINFSDPYPQLSPAGGTGKGLKTYFRAESTDLNLYLANTDGSYSAAITIDNLVIRPVNGIPGLIKNMNYETIFDLDAP